MLTHIGLCKTTSQSNVCGLVSNGEISNISIYSNDYFTNNVNSTGWPYLPLQYLCKNTYISQNIITECRDIFTAKVYEEDLNISFPFIDHLYSKSLENFSGLANKNIYNVNHNEACAYSALPFFKDKSTLLLVIGSGGNRESDILDTNTIPLLDRFQYTSTYTLFNDVLSEVNSSWYNFLPAKHDPNYFFSDNVIHLYKEITRFLFGDSSKLDLTMKLSKDGTPLNVSDFFSFLNHLNWQETPLISPNSMISQYALDLAATAQNELETFLINKLVETKRRNIEHSSIILAGDGFFNPLANSKLLNQNIFDSIYISPFCSNSGLSLGLAYSSFLKNNKMESYSNDLFLDCCFGPIEFVPSERDITMTFKGYKVSKQNNIIDAATNLLVKGQTIAWFNGRPESTTRSLTSRCLLTSPNYVTSSSPMMREVSCLTHKKSIFFNFSEIQESPYKAYAAPFNNAYTNYINTIGYNVILHTVQNDNTHFSKLLKNFDFLINESLLQENGVHVKSIQDLLIYMQKSPIKYAIVENFVIERL